MHRLLQREGTDIGIRPGAPSDSLPLLGQPLTRLHQSPVLEPSVKLFSVTHNCRLQRALAVRRVEERLESFCHDEWRGQRSKVWNCWGNSTFLPVEKG
jgi:DNA-binding transcriptional LysR family regulator